MTSPTTVDEGGGIPGHRQTRPSTSAGVGATSLMPITLKGLSFLRSKSAPPTPREGMKIPVALEVDDGDRPVSDDGGGHADKDASGGVTTIPEGDTLGTDAGCAPLSATTLAAPVPVTANSSGGGIPAFEAVLVNRKRHLAGLGGSSGTTNTPATGVAGTSSTASLPAGGGVEGRARPMTSGNGRGTRFKSSPLGGVSGVGVIVAEKVKEDMGDGGNLRDEEDGTRIPDEKDKEGPDKV